MMSIKLLLADDSVTVQKLVSLAFSDENVEIESVFNGDTAMDSIRVFKPNIVLADVSMPGCNGYELCERIKNDATFADIPVILLVGTFEPFDETEASRVKCDGHLTKPFDTSELIQTVQSLVRETTKPSKSDALVNPSIVTGRIIGLADKSQVSSHVWNSFLGSERILDLFDPEILALAELSPKQDATANERIVESAPADMQLPTVKDVPSEEFINSVAARVVRQMSPDIIREVAWEVVPELSELLIRRAIEEQHKP
jgi:CheY-like chemotaxis protein